MTRSKDELEQMCAEASRKTIIQHKKNIKIMTRNCAYFENKPQLAACIFGPKKTPKKIARQQKMKKKRIIGSVRGLALNIRLDIIE